MSLPQPVADSERIQSLDVLRGFALLGILLLNILGFGLHSAGYFNPEFGAGSDATRALNLGIWAGVDVLFEGAMRALFSILFGAGVVLFTTGERGKGARLHYARNFWLLAFGFFDAYVLLWSGDILITYALAGMLLYPLRNVAPWRLIISAGVLTVLLTLMSSAFHFGLDQARQASLVVAEADGEVVDAGLIAGAEAWADFMAGYDPEPDAVQAELEARRGSYASAFAFNVEYMKDTLAFTIPVILFWDALVMMLLGMALFRLGVLDGSRTLSFYAKLSVWGFGLGLAINGWESWQALAHGFDPLDTHANMRPTYHLGRLTMALGYIGLVMMICRTLSLPGLRARLAAVGRMALTNYLMHSLICVYLFTGAGLALVGALERWQLYLVVLAIWAVQLLVSPWWLERYRFGPVEWLWRALTYGHLPALRR